jgi:hypothetical protein
MVSTIEKPQGDQFAPIPAARLTNSAAKNHVSITTASNRQNCAQQRAAVHWWKLSAQMPKQPGFEQK